MSKESAHNNRIQPSPRVTHLSWGRVEVEGREGPYKDAKLYPGGSREWDWNETGTHHVPGTQPADVQELLDHGARVIILSRGMLRRLQVHPDTVKMLEDRSITLHVLQTEKAVRLYNDLRESTPLGALFHSTC
ncbi:MAG: Mth938-like domain-containing protein [Fidelibacterota bacterium]